MTITYPAPQKANRFPQPVLAPTPELRAQAAVSEAIGHFLSVARAGGMIGLFLGMLLSNIVDAEGDWMLLLIFASFIVSISLSLSAVDFRLASKRPKFRSGVAEGDIKSKLFNWSLWAAFIGATGGGVVCLIWHKEIGLSRSDGLVLSPWLLIMGQLVSILMETLQGAKLLRFAQSVREAIPKA